MSIIERALDKLDRVQESIDSRVLASPEPIRDPKLESKPDVQRAFDDVPVQPPEPPKPAKTSRTVSLNLAALNKAGVLVPNSLNKRLVEEYRRIKRPILQRAFPESGLAPLQNLVVVTSSVAGEGKSYSSLNLAMSIGTEVDRTVLLVDADVFKQTLTAKLGLADCPGLTDYLANDGADLSDYLVRTNIGNLSLLPAGRQHQKVTELWASDRMRELMTELSKRYPDRLVIFDSPPLLQESSAAVLASMVGQVIIVVEAEKTPQHVVKEALANIDDPGKVGLLLNKSNQRFGAGSRYGYGYY